MVALPLVTEFNRFYWTAGADGVLRLTRCTACGALLHPPAPVCGYCRAQDTRVTEVEPTGVVVGYTVNHQQWQPDLRTPYVIASVALDADPRVRLTTNIVGCPPDDVRIGMRVTARFARHEDVWLVLFTPTGEPDQDELPVDDVDPEQVRRLIRPMAGVERYEDKVAITGIGMTPPGRRLMTDPLALATRACLAAVEDAGLTLDDVDGLSTYPGRSPVGGFSEGGVTALADALGLRPTWFNGAEETPGPGGSLVTAMLAVASGLCRHVLCVRTVWQSTYTELLRTGRAEEPGGRVGPPMDLTAPYGALSAANVLGVNASHYLRRYGASRETLGWIALTARANAGRNPDALYRTPITMADYLSARTVSTPFGLLDCDVPCDASVAVVVSAAETAGDLRQRPVLVEAVGTQITERLAWDQSTLTHEPQVLGPAAHLWSRTQLRPGDVDVALLYDGFTYNALCWLESLGFCGIGEAKDFLDGGRRIALDGELPLNPHGGQLSHGRTHGYGFVHEAVTQLRGAAGARQVAGARVAVVSSGGLTPASCLLLTSG
ncbi:thiolase C-terminal domain-containing protein [Actinophytocola sp.]|uniref:thiolase C-terminal domain-containing protein n=1 Tax=Actinophytocola sp. TaxID=1872138 RepID=UPI002EDB180D